jgi:hypothetical protein
LIAAICRDPAGVAVLLFQKDSALAQWYRQRTPDAPWTRKTLIVTLARKLLIALWRLARDGLLPEGYVPLPDRVRWCVMARDGDIRACPQLSRIIAATNWTAARKFRASLS